MDLNDVHRAQISRFASFCKGKRDGALSDIEGQKNDFETDRLSDGGAIFNCADVRGLLDAYHAQVIACVRDELEKTANLSAVFASQLLSQAQASGITLQVEDVSIIEDQHRIGQINALPVAGAPPLVPKARTLSALEGGGASDPAALQEVQDLKEESRVMKERNMQLQTEMSAVLRERSLLCSELEQLKAAGAGASTDAAVAEYARQLAETKAMLDQKVYELDTAKRDFSQQLSQSTQFLELKSIVRKKTGENKALRQHMQAAGIALPDDSQCIELQAEDD